VIVSEIMGSELMTVAAYCVTTSESVCVKGVSRKAVSAPMPDVSQATVGSKAMKRAAMPATAPTVKPGKTTAPAAVKPTKPTAAAAVKPAETAAATSATTSGKCGDIRHGAKRAHRNTCRQNGYRSLFHGTIPT
jgi:hypothetical protein